MKSYTCLNHSVIGGIRLGGGQFYILQIDALRAKLDKDCKKSKLINLMTLMERINLETSMVVFKDDDLSGDRVLN